MKPRSDSKTDKKIHDLARYLYESQYPVFFTGAGISTESGLPDFRGPDGVWTRRDKGLAPRPLSAPWDSVAPNKGHLAIVELQKIGKVKFLISQNVDNLHLKSGIRPDLLAELHGNMTKLRCTRCQQTIDQAATEVEALLDGPRRAQYLEHHHSGSDHIPSGQVLRRPTGGDVYSGSSRYPGHIPPLHDASGG